MSNAVTTRVWVSCENFSCVGMEYKMWLHKPNSTDKGEASCFWGGDLLRQFCGQHFEAMTPIRLEPGECKPFDITISATEVKEST